MRTWYRSPMLWLSLVSLALLPTGAWAEADYAGTETCEACHEELVQTFHLTEHAVGRGWDPERACESCHGPGSEHVDAGGDVDKIQRMGEMAPKAVSETCLACHSRQEQQWNYQHSVHGLGEVGCADCHSPHSSAENLLDRKGAELCGECHQAIQAQFDLPRSHPIDDCATCHDPHASRSLRTDTSLFRETCTDCHFEKQGPYIYDHDVIVVDGCVSCHEVHGSPNRHLLKHEPQVNLCYQCHSASVTPGWHSVPRFLNEKCTTCHTAIHGSNTSPQFLEE